MPTNHGEEHETTLRSGVDEVSAALRAELQSDLIKAGVAVDETRLTHLAYAPEIAGAMLRRQQAEAVIAARQKIVHGGREYGSDGISELEQKQIVAFDENRKSSSGEQLAHHPLRRVRGAAGDQRRSGTRLTKWGWQYCQT